MAQNPNAASPLDDPNLEIIPAPVAQKASAPAIPAPRSAPIRDHIVKRATELGVDPDLALSIIQQESGGNPNVRNSPKGAVGIAQVMPGTYKMMMGTNDGQGDPYNSIEAGLRYLRYGQNTLKTKDPMLLAAGYHSGMDRADLKAGKIPNTNDGMISTADYARNVAGRSMGTPAASANRNKPMSSFEELNASEPDRYEMVDPTQLQLDQEEPGRYEVLGHEDVIKFETGMKEQAAIDGKPMPAYLKDKLTGGYDNMAQSLSMARWAVAGGDAKDLSEQLAKQFADQSATPKSTGEKEIDSAFKDVTDAHGAWDTTKKGAAAIWTAATNPKALAGEVVGQAANSLPTMAAGAAGAGTGAGIGAFGGVPGAIAGAIIGGRSGMAAGTTATELGGEVTDMIQKRLAETNTPPTAQNILAVMNEKGFQESARTQGLKKGLTVAAIDQVFLGVGGKIASAPVRRAATRELADAGVDVSTAAARKLALASPAGKAAIEAAKPSVAARVGAGAAAVGVDAVGETIGEGASQAVARGTVDYGEALREGVMSLGQSGSEVAAGVAIENGKRAIEASRATVNPTENAPSTAAGPLQRAAENASAQPDRVTATAPDGSKVSGTVTGTSDDGKVQIVDDNGEVVTFQTGPGGVQIEQEAPNTPLSNALEVAAEQQPEAPTGTSAEGAPLVQLPGDPNGWVNQIAQSARKQADKAGLTNEIEGLFAKGLTANQVLQKVKDRIGFVDKTEQSGWIVGVRATLGIPSQLDEDGKGEFKAWQDGYNNRKPNQAQAPADTAQAAIETVADEPAAAPVAPPALSDMDEPALRERLKYLTDQAKSNGGWDKMLVAERRKVEKEINARAPKDEPAQEQPALDPQPAKVEEPAAPVQEAKSAEQANTQKRSKSGYAEVKLQGKKHFVTPYDDQFVIRDALGGMARDGAAPLKFATEADAIAHAAQNSKATTQPKGAANVETQEAVEAAPRQPEKAPEVTAAPSASTQSAPVGATPQKALDRIARGTAYFGSKPKAAEWIDMNGLGSTHEVVKGDGYKWNIVAKAASANQPENANASPDLGKPNASAPEQSAAQQTPDVAPGREVQGQEAAEAVTESDEVVHNGTRLYKTNIKMGGEVVSRWTVESPENRGRRESGDRNRGGDTIHQTLDDAKKAADFEAKQEQSKRETAAKRDAEKQSTDAADKDRKADSHNGFLDGMPENRKELTRKALLALKNFSDGGPMSIRARIESLNAQGKLEISTEEVPKIQPMSRSAYNRANNAEQAAHEKKVREAGTKTEYMVNGSLLGKTAYDYAAHLLEHGNDVPETNFGKTQEPTSVNDNNPQGKPASTEAVAEKAGAEPEQAATVQPVTKEIGGYLSQDTQENSIRKSDDAEPAEAPEKPAKKPRAAKAKAEPEAIAEPAAKERLTDAGEELTRNRRNKVTGITWTDVEGMNDTLKIKTVTKQNVWAKPNYEKMVEDGAPRWRAAILKAIYDKLAAKPDTGRTITDEQLKRYIDTMGKVRDAVMAELERIEADPRVKAAFESGEIKDFADKGDDMVQAAAVMGLRNVYSKAIFESVFPSDPGKSTFDRTTEQGKENNANALIIGGNNAISGLQFQYKTLAKARDLLMAGFPEKQEMWERSYDIGKTMPTADGDMRYRVLQKGSSFRLANNHPDGGFATEESAKEWARESVKRAKDDKPLPPSRGLDLSDVQRTGPDWRNGKDVTAADVKDHFGFRGVNLGEYVKANQKIAQIHLNHAYDALNDLADLMGVPPKAISLNGTLGIAIGAQGSGKALAHFVPGVNEINITRDSGAGALAHEWGHAADHYFAVQAGLGKEGSPFLTEHMRTGSKPLAGIRPELVVAFKTMTDAMANRDMTKTEAQDWVKNQRERTTRSLKRFLADIKPKDQAAYDDVSAKLMVGDIGEKNADGVPENLAKYDALTAHSKDSMTKAQVHAAATRADELKDEAVFLNLHKPQTATNFAKASSALDAKKTTPYWSSKREMFARAFESYVMDKLSDQKRESLYLSGLSDGPMWTAWEKISGQPSPYPKADERLAINHAAQSLVDAIQTKEDGGSVTMFMQDEGQPYSADDAQEVESAIEGKSVSEIASWLAENAPKPEQREVAQKVASAIRRMQEDGATFNFRVAHLGDVAHSDLDHALATTSFSLGLDRKIRLDVSVNGSDVAGRVGTAYEPVLHELVHAVTVAGLEFGQRKQFRDTDMAEFADDLQEIRKLVMHEVANRVEGGTATKFEKRLQSRANNSMADIHEVVAWTLTNTDMQHLMETIPSGNQTLWSKFVEAIRKFLGLPANKATALSDVLQIAEKVMNTSLVSYTKDFKLDPDLSFSEQDGTKTVGRTITKAMRDKYADGAAPSQTETPAFKAWFGDSKVVDANGKPLVVYHGTSSNISEFDSSYAGSTTFSASGLDGMFFTDDPDTAERYAKMAQKVQHEQFGRFYTSANIMPAYLSTQNPFVYAKKRGDTITLLDTLKRKVIAEAKAAGHDGVIFKGFRDTPTGRGNVADTVVVFHPSQIKSATGNNGDFDATNPDIRFAEPSGWSKIDGNESEAPPVLTDKQSREDIALLEKRIDTARDGMRAAAEHPYRAVRLRDADALSAIGNAFGVRVVGFDVDPAVLEGQKYNFFSGVTFKKTNKTVYLNADTNRPHLAILGHETAHQMATRRPDIYAALVEAIRPYIDQKKYGTGFANSAVAKNVESEDGKREEFIGEVMSDAFMDPLFWSTLGKDSPTLLKQVYNFVVSILRKVAAAGGYTRQTAPYLTDYDRVIQIAAGAMAEFGMNPGEVAKKSLFGFTFAEKDTAFAEKPAVKESLTPPEQGMLRKVQAAIQDNNNRVRQVQERIEKSTGRKLPQYADYYASETNRPGRIAARLENAKDTLTNPLMEKLAKSGNTPEQLGELLHAMHAPERNERIAKINPEMPDGGSGMTTEEALAIQSKYSDNRALQALASEARDIAKATLELKLAYGLIDIDTFTTLSEVYAHYVPLKGDGEFGPKIKRAMGHDERQEHILENIARDYDQSIVTGERNLARQSLLQMVLTNPDRELWTVGVPPRGRYVAGKVYSVKKNGVKVATFTSEAQVSAYLEGKGPQAVNYEVVDDGGERVQAFVKPLQDNEVMVYVDGKAVRIQIMDDQLAAQLRPLDQGKMHTILEFMRSLNRYLSKIYTGYNPAFIMVNLSRDLMTGTVNILGNEGAATTAKAWANYPAALAAMGQWAATKKIPAGETGKFLEEYRANGGKVGASWMSDLEEQGKTLQRMYDDAYGASGYMADGKAGKAALIAGRKIVGGMAHVVEVANQATENGLRLALYMAMRKQGVSAGVAAQAAKNATVNFDRKGTMTPALGAIYLFFNPAVQGTANAAKTLFKGDHKGQAWAALGMLAALGFYAASQGMDDDKDRWLGEGWETRSKKMVLSIGGYSVSVPISLEFAPFYAMGVAMAEASRGESKMATAGRVVSSFIGAYFPLGGVFSSDSDNHGSDAMQAAIPTILKPAYQSVTNRNSFGSQIVPESEFTKERADNLKMFRGTKNTAYDEAAQGISKAGEVMGVGRYENDITKVSPETLKHLWRTYTGGLGAFITDSIGVARMTAADPAQVEAGDVPIVKSFVKQQDVKPIRGRFYDLAKDAKEAAVEFGQAKKAGDGDAMDKIMNDPKKADLLGLDRLVSTTAKAASKLRDQATDINADKSLTPSQKRAELKKLEQAEEELYRSAIGAFK